MSQLFVWLKGHLRCPASHQALDGVLDTAEAAHGELDPFSPRDPRMRHKQSKPKRKAAENEEIVEEAAPQQQEEQQEEQQPLKRQKQDPGDPSQGPLCVAITAFNVVAAFAELVVASTVAPQPGQAAAAPPSHLTVVVLGRSDDDVQLLQLSWALGDAGGADDRHEVSCAQC